MEAHPLLHLSICLVSFVFEEIQLQMGKTRENIATVCHSFEWLMTLLFASCQRASEVRSWDWPSPNLTFDATSDGVAVASNISTIHDDCVLAHWLWMLCHHPHSLEYYCLLFKMIYIATWMRRCFPIQKWYIVKKKQKVKTIGLPSTNWRVQ